MDRRRVGSLISAFKKILGEEKLQEDNFKKLMNRLAPEELKGFLLGGYILGEKTGEGGFAEVFKGTQLSTGKKVALKVLKPSLSEMDRARFLQEAEYLSRFDHPNIVRIYEQDEQPWRKSQLYDLAEAEWFDNFKKSHGTVLTYIAMEWIEGSTLDDIYRDMKEGKREYTEREIAVWFGQAAEALELIHNANLIHRDISPKNLMINGDNTVKLMDFGISRSQFEERTIVTSHGKLLGSEPYMSPEQLDLERALAEVGPWSDVYSLGSTFYELFTQNRIYNHNNDAISISSASQMKKHGEQPQAPNSINRKLSWEMSTIIMGCLEIEAGDRYESAQKLNDDINRYLNDLPIQYIKPSFRRRMQLTYKRNYRLINLSGIFILLIIMLTTIYVKSVVSERNHLLINQSLYLADMSKKECDKGDRMLAMMLAMEALPKNLNHPERPYVDEAWGALATAVYSSDVCVSLLKHNAVVTCASFSPDGKKIVTASTDGMAIMWDAVNGNKLLERLTSSLDAISNPNTIQFSPDGRKVLADANDGYHASWARIWCKNERRTKSFKYSYYNRVLLTGHEDSIDSAQFSPDGKKVVTASKDKTARIWDAETFKQLVVFKEHKDTVFSAKFSPDGKKAVTASADKTARIWDVENGKELLRITGHTDAVGTAQFSPDSKRIVTASADKTACIWDAENGSLQHRYVLTDIVRKTEFSPNGKKLLTQCGNSAAIWDCNSGRQLLLLNTWSMINDVQFSPDGKRIGIGCSDGSVWIWDAINGHVIAILSGHTRAVIDVIFSPDGNKLVTASADKTARLWDLRRIKVVSQPRTFFWHKSQFSQDGKRAMTTFSNGSMVRIWDLRNDKMITLHADMIDHAQFSPDGKKAVTASTDKTARIWDVENGKELTRLTGHTKYVSYAQFSPDGRKVVTASDDHIVRIWDAKNGKQLVALKGHNDTVFAAQFSPDGKKAVTASSDKTVRIWDVENGKCLKELKTPRVALTAQFSPDSKNIITIDGHLCLWDVENGEKIADLPGCFSIASYNLDGKKIVAVNGDKTACVIDAKQQLELKDFTGHTGSIVSAEFSPDDKKAITGSMDNSIRIWDVKSGKELVKISGYGADYPYAQFSPDGNSILGVWTDKAKSFDLDTNYMSEKAHELLRGRQLTLEERKLFYVEE